MDADVLVVGAGPTGLMLANQLVRRGVRTLIIDRNDGPSVATKAIGVQARTLEIYSHLGLAERAIELGKRGSGGNIWADGQRRARVGLSDAGDQITPYPYLLVLGQDDNERLMGGHLRELGASVEWNTELVSLTQRDDSVTAVVKRADGSQRKIEAAWVAGCDGARSVVREANGITFAGAPYEHVFFVADTEMTGTMIPDEVNVYLFRDGFHLLFPMRGTDHWRIAGILPPDLRNKPGLKFDEVVPSLRNEAGSSMSIKSCSWFSTYRIHHRRAVRFRDRRCFLLGDAAHVHSPVGAQGMNTGLQDAYNLGWKLALVVEKRASAAILDSYEQERIPVATALLNGTDRGFRLVVSDLWIAGLLRTKILARVAAFAVNRKSVQRMAFRTVSQTGIKYPKSSLSKSLEPLPNTAPQAGDRFPWLRLKLSAGGPVEDLFQKLDDRHFHLISVGQPAPNSDALGFGDLLRVHAIPGDPDNDQELRRARIPERSFYLVRPDGYVGLCGTSCTAQQIASYASQNVRLSVPPKMRELQVRRRRDTPESHMHSRIDVTNRVPSESDTPSSGSRTGEPITPTKENCMTKKTIVTLAVILPATAGTICAARLLGNPRPPQDSSARCAVVVPKDWGEYVGAGSYGLEFKDESGTIRFVKQFPCGLPGAPVVSLEVHRK